MIREASPLSPVFLLLTMSLSLPVISSVWTLPVL